MKHILIGLPLLLGACTGITMDKVTLPDGNIQASVTSFTKHPFGPNTQSLTEYICTPAPMAICELLGDHFAAGGGPIDRITDVGAAAVLRPDRVDAPSSTNVMGTSAAGAGASSAASSSASSAIKLRQPIPKPQPKPDPKPRHDEPGRERGDW